MAHLFNFSSSLTWLGIGSRQGAGPPVPTSGIISGITAERQTDFTSSL